MTARDELKSAILKCVEALVRDSAEAGVIRSFTGELNRAKLIANIKIEVEMIDLNEGSETT